MAVKWHQKFVGCAKNFEFEVAKFEGGWVVSVVEVANSSFPFIEEDVCVAQEFFASAEECFEFVEEWVSKH